MQLRPGDEGEVTITGTGGLHDLVPILPPPDVSTLEEPSVPGKACPMGCPPGQVGGIVPSGGGSSTGGPMINAKAPETTTPKTAGVGGWLWVLALVGAALTWSNAGE